MTALACDTTRRVPWPSELGFTRLTMLLRVAYADTPCDEDEEPDARAPQGNVILTWNAPWFRYRPSDGGPVQGWGAQSVECQILPDGTIAPPESTATSDGSVIVMPTVHELLEPSGSTITANIRLTTPGPKFESISFQARPGATIDILAEADMGKQPGVIVKPVVTETTAERAEAAALRAEQAAAGVADIGEQVEQVQAYTTRAETAASNAETAATSAEAASAEAATVTTDAAYIRDVIAQHGALKGDKGDPGPAPVVEWQGDRLSVDGQLSPALTGPAGKDGVDGKDGMDGRPGADGGPIPPGGSAGQTIIRTADGYAWQTPGGGLDDLSDRVDWIEQNGDERVELIDLNAPGDSYDIPSGWKVAALRAGSDGAVLHTVYGERVLGPNQWASEAEWAGQVQELFGTLTLVSGSISYGSATYEDRLYTPYSHLSDWNPHPEYVLTEDLPDGLSIVGPGRPDQPGTTGLLIDGSETVGTTYTSTDGAGVGAWVWRKRPNGWTVVDGDTGWVKAAVSGGADGHQVHLRRTNAHVRLKGRGTLTVSGYGAQLMTVPDGYRPEIADPTAGGDYNDLTWIEDFTTFKTARLTKTGLLLLANGPTVNKPFALDLTWPTAQPWPTSI